MNQKMRSLFLHTGLVIGVGGFLLLMPIFAHAEVGDTSTFLGRSYTGDGGAALDGYLDMPKGFVMSTNGTFYIADTYNTVIRKIDPAGTLSTFSGSGEYGSVDGLRQLATWSEPEAIARDSNGALYVADTGSSLIRKIENGTVSTLSINGDTSLRNPKGILVSGDTLYISDTGNNRVVKVSKSGGTLTEIATSLSTPLKMALNSNDLYVANFGDDNIIKVNVTTGSKTVFASDIAEPRALAIYDDELYIASGENGVWNEIWKKSLASGSKVQIAIRRETTTLNNAFDMAIREVSGVPYIYQLHGGGSTIWRFDIDGDNETLIAGKNRYGDEPGSRVSALLGRPQDIVVTPDGSNFYISYAQGNKIAEYSVATNTVTQVAGFLRDSYAEGVGDDVRFSDVVSMAVSSNGRTLYLADRNNNRIRTLNVVTGESGYLTGAGVINATGATDNGYQEGGACEDEFGAGVAGCAYFNRPTGIAITSDGATLYIADGSNNRVRKVVVATGNTSLIAGSGAAGFQDGIGAAATFNGPYTLTLSSDETTLYVADKYNHSIRAIDIATKNVTTLVGTGSIGYREGAFADAVLAIPEYIDLGPDGNLYVSEAGSIRVRKLDLTSQTTSLISGSGARGQVNGAGAIAEWNTPKGMAFLNQTMYVADFRSDLIRAVDLTGTLPGPLDTVKEGRQFMGYSPNLRGGYYVTAGNVVGSAKEEIVMGTGEGFGPHVQVFNREGVVSASFFAYAEHLRSGVRVTTGDVNGDGLEEIITAAGPGGRPHIRIFNGDGTLYDPGFFALDGEFKGGVYIASGDVNGDGRAEIVVTAGQGGGAQVTVHRADGSLIANFFAYNESFRGGIVVATLDTNNDGVDEILTGPENGSPHIQTFSLEPGSVNRLNPGFYAFNPEYKGGVSIAGGDYNGNGNDEIIVGVGPGAEPHVKIYDKRGTTVLAEFRPYARQVTGGVVVAAGDVDGDGLDEVLIVPRSGGGPQVRIIDL
ncbi:VCBS repeat-containing protein [Patescibacteria group bacterium]|nr:VCBS repeat-containing protein [Patescibacteria group bacterium]MBU1890730.1 VCBS repeat-containing protein [Patescibacteria group bacterium]